MLYNQYLISRKGTLIEQKYIYLVCMCFPQPKDRVEVNGARLKISNLALEDSGMYQCVAENKHGTIYSSAELRVQGRWMCSSSITLLYYPPSFLSRTPLTIFQFKPQTSDRTRSAGWFQQPEEVRWWSSAVLELHRSPVCSGVVAQSCWPTAAGTSPAGSMWCPWSYPSLISISFWHLIITSKKVFTH